MCGITGIVSSEVESKDRMVREMNSKLIHRGPDETGWYSDQFCTLAMRRLSIIDLANGSQPKYNTSGTSLVFFNGEIYNYEEIAQQLQQRGYKLKSKCDTELLVHLYDEFGEQMIKHLKGMFVFCIYNRKDHEYFFGRDRFGEKPLFFYHERNTFIFSSEIGSLLSCPLVPRRLNLKYLQYYLTATFVPEPHTLLQEVFSLPPGHFLKLKNNIPKVCKYYDVTKFHSQQPIASVDEAIELIAPAFQLAVRQQMFSDVPLGAFLSGGIDSSTVAATMQSLSSRPICTFNVKFEDASYDESGIAKEVADYLGTDHHQIVVPNAEFNEEIFWNIIDHVGLPFPDSSAIPTYYVSREIRKHVKVALSGDGGDELFGGYTMFDWYRKVRSLSKLPISARKPLSFLLSNACSIPYFENSSKLRQVVKAFDLSMVEENQLPLRLHAMFSSEELKGFYGLESDQLDLMTKFPEMCNGWGDLRKIMLHRLKFNLPLDMLTKVDRMSMANSLEVRVPFLDHNLFEISSRLPDSLLMKNSIGKVVLRHMMKDKLPKSVFNHPKSGFSIPLHKYQNDSFKHLTRSLLLDQKVLNGLVTEEFVNQLVSAGFNQQTSNARKSVYKSAHQLWSLLQLGGWINRFNIDTPIN